MLDVAHGHVVAHCRVVAQEVLEDGAGMAVPVGGGELAQVDAIHQDTAARGTVEAQQELHQGGLAGAVLADQRDPLAGADGQGDVGEGRRRAAGVGEGDVLDGDPVADRAGEPAACFQVEARAVDEGEVVLDIAQVAGDGEDVAGHASIEVLEALDGVEEGRSGPDAHAPGDEQGNADSKG